MKLYTGFLTTSEVGIAAFEANNSIAKHGRIYATNTLPSGYDANDPEQVLRIDQMEFEDDAALEATANELMAAVDAGNPLNVPFTFTEQQGLWLMANNPHFQNEEVVDEV